jgi:LysR family transcriptional regulator, glycine cleavage system transcriptional activator
MKRTHLPLNGLRVLDAAARYLSFTRAADELAVTPAAVGQQIRTLEDVLGVVLFRRTAKGLELTPEGAAGLDALRRGFLEFEEAVRAMQAQQSSKRLTIAAPRDFTAKWLASKLADYGRTDADLGFHLLASDDSLDFTQANLDVAVCLAEDKGEHEGVMLGSRAHATIGRADAPDRVIGWPGNMQEDRDPVITVADAGLAIDAAAAGLGRATVPALLAEADIVSGRVVEFGRQDCARAYWLIAPVPQWRQKKVKALVTALTE